MSQAEREQQHAYAQRMNRVLDYISANLQGDLNVDRLAQIASSSKYHFQRQFRAYTGVSVARIIRLMRLKRASYQLAFSPHTRIIEVGLDAGFSSPEAFTRAFKSAFGQTPTEFRTAPKWDQWSEQQAPPIRRVEKTMNVTIEELPSVPVAVLEHHGSPSTLNASVARFIEWRRSSGLSPVATSGTYGIPYSDPEQGPAEEWHFDICGSVTSPVGENTFGIINKNIPGGRVAVAEHVGSTDAIGDTVMQLYSKWLPQSGEELRDFPCFFKYVKRMPAVPEHEQLTLVYLPLASAPQG